MDLDSKNTAEGLEAQLADALADNARLRAELTLAERWVPKPAIRRTIRSAGTDQAPFGRPD
jgi:hypothetical protein